uniref:Protein pxr1 n=1 Tax=Aspergillus clavatus (strain ATCC 1007 / CBS 513.65 / DSM 816 / NCTC 3887 / NRRL 1 / QM 1276 / 107) TaxID=344612 RepID=PXR1_ASPCL|nr:RecName: Full=Protein pxr1; AltName: Full=PinX1-related protein 1 [Aspergillus clavatus NRRL 1]
MGLAAPRKRTKISHDPNNTTWSRSTDGFGHRILKAQGWTPGSFLGPRNAAHSDLFTTASASHIRVVLKDDNLGLGARPKRGLLDEPTGLDAFKGLLGRLNGKSETQLVVEQQKRDDIKLARYAAAKWQAVRFVSGGLLVQESNETLVPPTSQNGQADSEVKNVPQGREEGLADDETTNSDSEDRHSVEKRKKKETNSRGSREKERKREKRQMRRDKKRKTSESTESEAEMQEKTRVQGPSEDVKPTEPKAPTLSRERRPMGRQMFRGRYIAQKKRALMDDKSLNEIFMIST